MGFITDMIHGHRLNRHQRELLRTLKTYAPVTFRIPENENRKFERSLRLLDAAVARDLTRFIHANIEVHDSLGRDLRTVLNDATSWNTLVPITAHFDFAVGLGWNYAPCAVRMIVDAIRDSATQSLSPEQERALIAVENSTWTKKYTTGGGMMKRAYSYHGCVSQAAIKRPLEVQRIISAAQRWNPQSVAQVGALLDGKTLPALSEGAL